MYRIQKDLIFNSKHYPNEYEVLTQTFSDYEEANNHIVALAESYRDVANVIQHHTARSIVYLGNRRIELSRI